MIEGLWIVQYEGVQGNGGGVAVFVNGKILGGDTGYTYVGSYTEKASQVNARVHVGNFLPGVPNVLGLQGDFDLEISAPLTGNVIKGSASLVGRPGAGIAVKLTKKADL